MASGSASRAPSQSNEVRRAKYHGDEKYREVAKDRAREYYRSNKIGTFFGENIARANIGRVRDFGRVRNGAMTLLPSELAAVVGRSYSALSRWMKNSLVPSPTLNTNDGDAYSLPVARAIVRELADHFDKVSFYRRDHQETRAAIWGAVSGLTEDEDSS